MKPTYLTTGLAVWPAPWIFFGGKLNSSVISDVHRKAGERLKMMMEKRGISIANGMERFGVSRVALLAYRAGANTIPYKVMQKMIDEMKPELQELSSFLSAVQHSAIESWRLHGESKKAKQRRGEI